MCMPHSFVRFIVSDRNRFAKLRAAFEAIKQDKEVGVFRDVAEWLDFFDNAALERFWWPTREDMAAYTAKWQAASVEDREQNPLLSPPSWDFESLFAAFEEGDYDLISCELISNNLGELRFEPHGYPYGGTDCMHMLIQAFGFSVVGEDDGTGYHRIDS